MPTPPQRIREAPGVERAPSSVQASDTGHAWLDRRSDASAVEGAFAMADRQRRIKQLGETDWLGHPSLKVDQKGSKEQPLATEGGRVQHLYRGMSEGEFQEAKARGHIQSDERGVIQEGWEGTNAATDPASAHVYLPRTGTGRIVKMEAHEGDSWFSTPLDGYARTRAPIPWSRVVAHTEEFAHPDSDEGKSQGLNLRQHVINQEKVEKAATVMLGGKAET